MSTNLLDQRFSTLVDSRQPVEDGNSKLSLVFWLGKTRTILLHRTWKDYKSVCFWCWIPIWNFLGLSCESREGICTFSSANIACHPVVGLKRSPGALIWESVHQAKVIAVYIEFVLFCTIFILILKQQIKQLKNMQEIPDHRRELKNIVFVQSLSNWPFRIFVFSEVSAKAVIDIGSGSYNKLIWLQRRTSEHNILTLFVEVYLFLQLINWCRNTSDGYSVNTRDM